MQRSLSFRYRHGSYLSVPSAPLTRPALPSQSYRHRRRSPHRVCPASRTRPAAAIRRYGRSRALPTLTNSLSFYLGPRPDNYLFAPSGRRRFRTSSVVCSLRFQSVVRTLALPPPKSFMMRISHTRRSRSPVTHPKTPVDSTPRPISAAAPRKRAPTLYYKSHPSFSSYY